MLPRGCRVDCVRASQEAAGETDGAVPDESEMKEGWATLAGAQRRLQAAIAQAGRQGCGRVRVGGSRSKALGRVGV